MCILIVKQAGSVIDDVTLENSYDANPDGWGFSYVDLSDNKLIVKKAVSSFSSFLKHYRKAEENNPDSNFLIHFRIATSGGIKKVNCHPFKLNEDIVFAHNGIFSNIYKSELQGDENDTRAFGRLILGPLYEQDRYFYINPVTERLVEGFIESRNKVAILDVDNSFHIFNESAGEWKEGIWYSNTSYKWSRKNWKNNYSGRSQGNALIKTPESKFKGVTCTSKNGIIMVMKKKEANITKVKSISADGIIGLTKVSRLFKVNTVNEREDGIIKFWDDETEGWYERGEVDDLILIKYMSGKENYCHSCNMMLENDETTTDSMGSTFLCSYCKTKVSVIYDDMVGFDKKW